VEQVTVPVLVGAGLVLHLLVVMVDNLVRIQELLVQMAVEVAVEELLTL
jgi:hypothetical protein